MSYIGKEPQVGAYHMLDSLTASATADYTLQLDGVNFVPESANHLIVSLNGVIQKAGSSFTVSSSTLSFSSALTSSDSIDFVLSLGNVLDIGTPSDSTVTNAKTNFVSTSSSAGLQIKGDNTTAGTLQLNCEQNSHGIKLRSPSHSAGASYTLTFPTTDGNADEFLKTDGSGALSWATAGGTNTPAWIMGASASLSLSYNSTTKLPFNTSIKDTDSGVDTTNYKYTIPSGEGGTYVVHCYYRVGSGQDSESLDIFVYKNGSLLNNAEDMQAFTVNQSYNTIQCTGMLVLSAGDYLEMYARQASHNSTNTVLYSNEGRFWGFKLIE